MRMRDDNIVDFHRDLKRFLSNHDELPPELREELRTSKEIMLQSSGTLFAVKYVTEDGVTKAASFSTFNNFKPSVLEG